MLQQKILSLPLDICFEYCRWLVRKSAPTYPLWFRFDNVPWVVIVVVESNVLPKALQ